MPSYPKDKETDDPELRHDKPTYWLRWIKRAKECQKGHWSDADAAWEEYENPPSNNPVDDPAKVTRCYPIYHSSSKYLESAYYAKDPEPKARRRFGSEDDYALTQSLIAERLGDWLIENSYFGEAMRASRDNFIHADFAANQWIYDYDIEPGMERVELSPGTNEAGAAAFYLADGNEHPGEVLKDDRGYFYEANTQAAPTNRRLILKAIQYDEVLFTPDAKAFSDIKDVAFFVLMDEGEAKERFPNVKDLPFSASKNSRDDETYEDPDKEALKTKYLRVWEIYCTEDDMVYWVCEGYHEFLDKKPISEVSKFRNKFPITPVITSSKPRKSLFPTPAFKQLEPTINQLHKQYANLMLMVEAARPRYVVNTDDDDVITALENLKGLTFIKAKNFHDILEKAGLQNLVQQVPVDGIVAAMSQLISLEETFRTNFAEWFGTPDIIKGVSEGEKTKAEVEIEHGAAYDRFTYQKKLMEKLARDSLEMGIDLILDEFPDEEIARICGWQFMERGEVDPETGEPITMSHYERFFDALNQMRNDEERLVRIDIETDSTSFTNEMREMQRRRQIFDTVLQGLSTIGGMQNPEFMAPVVTAFLGVLEAVGGATMEEDAIKNSIKELEEAKAKPPPPPPPDFTEMKVQVAAQANQIKAQKDAMDNQVKNRELDRKEYEVMMKERQQMFDQQAESLRLQLEQILTTLEQQRVQIEGFNSQAQAQESALEEMRLAIEMQAPEPQEMPEMKKSEPQQSPPIVVVEAQKQPAGRVATVVRGPDGNIGQILFQDVGSE